MKFIVEFQLKPGSKYKMADAFEQRGPNRSAGVSFRDAWLGSRSEVVFVLCESAEETLVEQACQAWKEFGDYQITPVINIEQV